MLRFFLFSGGAAIAGAMIERAFGHQGAPLAGLGLGLLAGFVAFRSQLFAARWPRLVLTDEALHVLRPRGPLTIAWDHVAQVTVRGERVEVAVQDGAPLVFDAKKLGTTGPSLGQALKARGAGSLPSR